MDRRGEVEIVINARWVERALFLLIIVALIGVLLWRGSGATADADATSLARIAELEMKTATQTTDAAALRLQVASLQAENEDLKQPPPVPVNTTKPVVAPPPPSSVAAVLNVAWEYTGQFLDGGKYRLGNVTIFVTSTRTNATSLSYELCWSLIDCEKAVTRDTILVPARGDIEHLVTLTIPRTVDISPPQKLKLVVREGASLVLSEEEIIR